MREARSRRYISDPVRVYEVHVGPLVGDRQSSLPFASFLRGAKSTDARSPGGVAGRFSLAASRRRGILRDGAGLIVTFY